ncbi:thioredoxin family protein [Candidatus Marinamargulisbacteria bacterium SCGC AG-439-L15]|nr:thioredoxin family protein [Candidatus Marinamargulisbacteria bacterium SCGC AG-439-L15]
MLLESTYDNLGEILPPFILKDAKEIQYARDEVMGDNGIFLCFTCNHCPYAIAVWDRVITLAEYAKDLGVSTVAINPNINPSYPEDSPSNMLKMIEDRGISFPYLVDEDQSVSKNYGAICTPDNYLLNREGRLVYRGRIDDNWKDANAVTQENLKIAISELSKGVSVKGQQYPSMGCSIKWCD